MTAKHEPLEPGLLATCGDAVPGICCGVLGFELIAVVLSLRGGAINFLRPGAQTIKWVPLDRELAQALAFDGFTAIIGFPYLTRWTGGQRMGGVDCDKRESPEPKVMRASE